LKLVCSLFVGTGRALLVVMQKLVLSDLLLQMKALTVAPVPLFLRLVLVSNLLPKQCHKELASVS
jgi:hypothetical protein